MAAARLGAAAFSAVTLISMANIIGAAVSGSLPTGSTLLLPVTSAAVAALCAFTEILYGGVAARAEERRVRAKLLTEIFRSPAPPDPTDKESDAGQLVTLLTDNAERLTEYRQVYFGATLAAVSIPFLTLIYVAVAFNPIVGLTLLAMCPLIPILIGLFMSFFRKTSAHSRSERSKLSGKYLDAIRNLVLIRLMGAGPRVESQLRAQGEQNRGAIMKLLAGNQVVIIVMDGLFSLLLICAAAALSVGQFHAGNLTLSQAIAIMFLTTLLVEPLVQVAGFFYIGMGGMASERRIAKFLRQQSAKHTKTEATSAADPADSSAEIVLSGVSFDYGRGNVLDNVSLRVPQGTKAALIGRSGAGKSTLLSLLRGTLPLQDGDIRIGGSSFLALDPPGIRQLTASVSQRTWMFTGTIADNLRLAQPDASEMQMWEALEAAQVADEIARMPLGLDTPLGEQGALISGGQAQRISLARALLSGRKTLLLDEPTSQIDVESEDRLISALGDLGPEWTLLMVTHRHSLLAIADSTWDLKEGKLQRHRPDSMESSTPVLIGENL